MTYDQLDQVDTLLAELDWYWGDVTAVAKQAESIELTDSQQWLLLDKLNRLVVAVTKALPGAEARVTSSGPTACAESVAAERIVTGGATGGID